VAPHLSAEVREQIVAIESVKVAVVGCGHISDAYLGTMTTKFKILDVVGCCDLDQARAEAAAAKYGIRAMALEDILADPSIEVVVNLTTPGAHHAVSRRLLEAGKHVYTEKVLSVELADAADLVQLADERGLYLGAAPDTFLGSAVQTARFVVESGMIGEVSSSVCALARDNDLAVRAFPFITKPGGGIAFDVGIYYITALLSILGPVTHVHGVVRTKHPKRQERSPERFGEAIDVLSEDLMAGTLEFASGAVGTVLFDANGIFTLPEKPTFAMFGSLGTLYLADPNGFGGDVKVVLKGSSEPVVVQQSHAFSSECRGLGVAEMAWSIRLGRKNRASKEMAYHALDILHGMVRSSQGRTTEALASTFKPAPALPRGMVGLGFFDFIEEGALAN
jgi:predicted dehydrogenase